MVTLLYNLPQDPGTQGALVDQADRSHQTVLHFPLIPWGPEDLEVPRDLGFQEDLVVRLGPEDPLLP